MLLLVIIFSIALFFLTFNLPSLKTTRFIRLSSDGNKPIKLGQAFDSIVKNNHSFTYAFDIKSATIVFFEKLTDFQLFYEGFSKPTPIFYSLACIDHLASKSELYSLLSQRLGKDRLHSVVPPTMIITCQTTHKQVADFAARESAEMLIFKSNVQQQQGLKIIATDAINEHDFTNHVVVQKMLTNPYVIDGHKINLRQYVLVTCDMDSKLRFYAYDDGFVYYTKQRFESGSKDFSKQITTGYLDRSFYEVNPLTIRDFVKTLNPTERKVFQGNRLRCLTLLFGSIVQDLAVYEKKFPAQKFTILGVDLYVTSDLKVVTMEINKGCDLRFKDSDRDMQLKQELIMNSLDLVTKKKVTKFKLLSN